MSDMEQTEQGGAPESGCARCVSLRKDVKFWRDQQKFAADMVSSLADLNDYDGRVAVLRSMLGAEKERRRAAERENAVLTYRLGELEGTNP